MRLWSLLVFFTVLFVDCVAFVVSRSKQVSSETQPQTPALSDLASLSQGRQALSVLLSGGLGNQLFQLAALFSAALDNKLQFQVVLPDVVSVPYNRTTYWNSSLKKLQPFLRHQPNASLLAHTVDDATCVVEQLPGSTWSLVNTSCANASAFASSWASGLVSAPAAKCRTLTLHGYFQSSGFFSHHLTFLRSLLWDESFAELASKRLSSLVGRRDDNHSMVSIHYRLGDYDNLGWVLDQDYYQAALDEVRKRTPGNVTCVIFSDEPQRALARSAVLDGCGSRVLVPKEETDVISFYMMSLLSVNILADSSFSYWAGLLGREKRLVVVPDIAKGSNGCWSYFSIRGLKDADPQRDWVAVPARSISSQALFTEELIDVSDPDPD